MTGFTLRLGTATAVSAARSDYLLQIGVGAAASEQVVVEVPIGFRAIGTTISLPLFVPAGSRISVRHKGFVLSKTLAYTFDYYGSPNRDGVGLPQKWVLYGKVDDASNSRGTEVTAGSTNAWGSWTSLTASTTYPHELWVPCIDGGTVGGTTALNYRSQFALASTTDAATEVTNSTVYEGPLWNTASTELMNDQMNVTAGTWVIGGGIGPNGYIYHPKPAGSPVSMRAMCSGTAEASCFGSILAAVM
jgi:hypothetical protein